MALPKTVNGSRVTLGDDGKFGKKGVISVVLNKFDIRNPATASTTAVAPATAGATTGATVVPVNFEFPSPRSVTVTAGGTTANILGPITVSGLNAEGKPFSETIAVTAATAGTYNGTKAFFRVTSFTIPTQAAGGATYSIGSGANFGIAARNLSVTQVRLHKTVVASGNQSLVLPGSTNFSTTNVEDNWVTLDVTASGLSRYRVYAFNYNWHLNPVNDLPVYGV